MAGGYLDFLDFLPEEEYGELDSATWESSEERPA